MSDLDNLKLVLRDFYEILTDVGKNLNDSVNPALKTDHKDLCDMWLSSLMHEIDEVQAEYPFSFVVDSWGIVDKWGEFSEELEQWLDEHAGQGNWVCVDIASNAIFAFKALETATFFRLKWN